MSQTMREKFEAAVIERLKEGGFLEVEIRVECLARSGDDYIDGSVSAYWHFWQKAAASAVPAPAEATPPSYHDVVVFAGDQRLRLFDCSYGLQLHCTRAAGWQLWNVWGGKEELLAGEYNPDKPIRVEVRDMVICETKPSEGDDE